MDLDDIRLNGHYTDTIINSNGPLSPHYNTKMNPTKQTPSIKPWSCPWISQIQQLPSLTYLKQTKP